VKLITKFNTRVAFCILYSILSSVLAYFGEMTSGRINLYYWFCFYWLMAWWVKEDVSQNKIYGPYEFPAFVFFGWPAVPSLLPDKNRRLERNPDYRRISHFDHGTLFTSDFYLLCKMGNMIILSSFNMRDYAPIPTHGEHHRRPRRRGHPIPLPPLGKLRVTR